MRKLRQCCHCGRTPRVYRNYAGVPLWAYTPRLLELRGCTLVGKGGDFKMAKKSRGGRMTAAKKRAKSGRPGGKGMVKNRPAGRNIMKT